MIISGDMSCPSPGPCAETKSVKVTYYLRVYMLFDPFTKDLLCLAAKNTARRSPPSPCRKTCQVLLCSLCNNPTNSFCLTNVSAKTLGVRAFTRLIESTVWQTSRLIVNCTKDTCLPPRAPCKASLSL